MSVGSIPQSQRAYWFFGDLVIVHLSGEETDGRFSLTGWVLPPEEMTPLHVHRHSDQTAYVLEGELTLHLPGQDDCGRARRVRPRTDGRPARRAHHVRRAREARRGERAGRVRTIRGSDRAACFGADDAEPAAAAPGL
jgi:hypothetical protein